MWLQGLYRDAPSGFAYDENPMPAVARGSGPAASAQNLAADLLLLVAAKGKGKSQGAAGPILFRRLDLWWSTSRISLARAEARLLGGNYASRRQLSTHGAAPDVPFPFNVTDVLYQLNIINADDDVC